MNKSILLVEDEKLMRITLEDALRAEGYDVLSFENGAEALEALKSSSFDVAVTDIRLPDMNGFDIVTEVVRQKNTPIIVMTAFGTIKDAVEAMKLGAFDYLTKPFVLEEFLLLIERALELGSLRNENIRLKNEIGKFYSFPNIIGESKGMKKLISLIEKVAESNSNVLILGESGTGKELAATTIHYQSLRKDMPLIKVNCAALPEGLIESELFGHEKGAFTGAIKKKPGRFELADKGTIFLDEIGDLPLSTQAKLLRVIQERAFERVGGTETLSVDIRIITATNKDLSAEVRKGRFREDLYYRLNVIPITIPPLRERREDIPYLSDFFLNKLSSSIRFSKDAMDALCEYDYPGNVRELENIIERCVALSGQDIIEKDDLPPFIMKKESSDTLTLSDISANSEREHIIKILKRTKGSKTISAELLGISRKTLWEKINTYKIKP